MKPYAVTVSHSRSLHAAAYLRAASAAGVPPALVLSVGLFTVARARTVARAIGVKKAAQKIIRLTPLGSLLPGALDREAAPLVRWMEARGFPPDAGLEPIARELGIAFERCDALDGARCLSLLSGRRPAFAVYLGGGILRRPFIDAVNGVVINAHQGPLPAIRGMNAVEWAIYLGLTPEVTVHLIDAGIDTGPICFARPIPVERGDTIADVRGRSTVLSVEMLLDAVAQEQRGELPRIAQASTSGRQYFAMHQFLAELAESRLLGS